MTLATCSLSIYYLGQKLLGRESMIQAHEVTYWSGLSVVVSMIVSLTILEKRDRKVQNIFWVPGPAIMSVLGRAFFGFISNLCTTASIQLLPLAKATVLYYTNTIFIAIFGYFMRERITGYDVGGIITTFFGVVVFTMDPFNFSPRDFQA